MEPPNDNIKQLKTIEMLIANELIDDARDVADKFNIKHPKLIKLSAASEDWLGKFITCDSKMLDIKKQCRILSDVEDPVLITGPSGTGKELLAQALHGQRNGKFVDINCAGMPETLIESELFGHVRGAFTDARESKPGLLQVAQGGTIFLDEIGDLPLTLQAKLLRAVQGMKIRPVGGKDEVKINCRFVSATHHDLRSRIATGQFRLDLYYRISTCELQTTPLCERKWDIPMIIESLDKNFPQRHDICNYPQLIEGNVRSLQQIVRRWQLFKTLPKELM